MGARMLSRVADTIFWMHRYIERVENVVRSIEVHLNLVLDLPPEIENPFLPLLDSRGDLSTFELLYTEMKQENVMYFLVFDLRNPNALINCISQARENARSLRERISTEMWQHINQLYLFLNNEKSKGSWSLEEMFLFLEQVKKSCYGISGLAYNTLSRTDEWHVAKLGRHLERSDQLTRILDVQYDALLPQGQSAARTVNLIQWGTVLRATSGYEMYRRVHGVLDAKKIALFLVLNAEFPRSLRHNIFRVQEACHALTKNPIGSYHTDSEKELGKLRASLDYADQEELFYNGLHHYLDKIQDQLFDIGQLFYNDIFGFEQ
jgi:uncharacterized alpha-E superfamily protein